MILPALFSDRYRLELELGRGGAATVYRATDIRLERAVAVKILHQELAHAIGHGRFLREIRIASQLRHPHIVPVLDFGEADGQLWYAMPQIDGGSLRDRIERESQLRIDDALRWCGDIADALAYAHTRGFVHRDVKPENILLDGEHAWLADFGIARGFDPLVADRLTSAGIAVGTPAYMSPEQATGASQLDGRSDVYSLACVLYEALAGVPPFVGPTAQSVIAQRFSQEPHPVTTYRKTVSAQIEEALKRGLQLAPADRIDAQSLNLVLRAESTGELRLPAGRALVSVPQRRWWSPKILGAAMLTAIVAAGVGALVSAARPAALDRGKVVLFPLTVSGGGADQAMAAGIPTLIGVALDGVPALRWVEGDNLVTTGATTDSRALHATRIAAARSTGAAYFIDGSALIGRDSITVVMRLVSADPDSALARVRAVGPRTADDVSTLALRAMGQLLPRLLEPGARIDLRALSDRDPRAIALFLLGEQEFRRSRYVEALANYEQALATDSSLAIAALKAARSARSLFREPDARRFVALALRRDSLLPGANLHFARGLSHFYKHQGDSAQLELLRTITLAPHWAEAHSALGDVHFYEGVDGVDSDSAATESYSQAYALDSTFTPTLYHLSWLALRRRDPLAARRFAVAYRSGQSPDTTFLRAIELGAGCQAQRGRVPDFAADAARSAESLVLMGKVLTGNAADLRCAHAAFSAVLAKDGEPTRDHFAALLGLNAIAAATADTAALRALAANPMAIALGIGNLMVFNTLAGVTLSPETERAVASLRERQTSLGPELQWLLGAHAGQMGDATLLNDAALALGRGAVAGQPWVSAPHASLVGRLRLLAGDTATAVTAFAVIDSIATFEAAGWGLFGSRASENLQLAQIALARRDARAAMRYAARLEHPYGLMRSVFLPQALQVRLKAALLARDSAGAAAVQRRMEELAMRSHQRGSR